MKKKSEDIKSVESIYSRVRGILETARSSAYHAVNFAMVQAYWHIGRVIVEHEQKGAKRAEYAKETLKLLSQELTAEFGRGFSVDNLQRMRVFYLMYKKYATVSRISIKSSAYQKSETLSRKSSTLFRLGWSHYVFLMRLPEAERKFYEIESVKQNWSLRELERQINSFYYERLL